MHLSTTLLLNLFQCSADVLQLPLIESVLKTPPLLVLLLELLELFLLLFELRQSRVDELEQFRNLCSLGVRVRHDTQGLGTTLLVDLGAGDLLQES